jgi:hypothetical protein
MLRLDLVLQIRWKPPKETEYGCDGIMIVVGTKDLIGEIDNVGSVETEILTWLVI